MHKSVKVLATDEQRDYAREFLKQGSMGNRGSFDGNDRQQLFGLIGQIIISDMLNIERPKNEHQFDGGFDIVWHDMRWDVKVLIGTVPWKPMHHVMNVHARQVRYDCQGYIFLHYDSSAGVYSIAGCMTKDIFSAKAEFYPAGAQRPRTDGTFMIVREGGVYEVRQKDMRPWSELHEKN